MAAFIFTEREKDYGGIHLGVPTSSIDVLQALADELTMFPPGHSRGVLLLEVPAELPRRIITRSGYRPLGALRIGTSVNALTRIQIEKRVGLAEFSSQGLVDFKSAIGSLQTSHGDILIAGDSGSWTDRLWFWPFEL